MKDTIILAIESSCDETSCAILKNNKLVANIVSTQIEVHQKYGGVMPEIASRLHLENIACVVDEALKTSEISMDEVDAIAVTRGPGLIGALHVGIQAAKTLALIYNKPLNCNFMLINFAISIVKSKRICYSIVVLNL